MKHTPGEWRLYGNREGQRDGDLGYLISEIAVGGHSIKIRQHVSGKTYTELKANVFLMVASPKLLASLLKAKEFYERCFEVTGGCDHSVGICECQDRAEYEELCAAITKATGK